MILSGLAKLLIGLILASSLLIGGGISIALYLRYRVTAPPPKPVFANDTMVQAKSPHDSTTAKGSMSADKSSTTPTPSKTPSPKPLEPGTYNARVTWSEGLSLHSEPNLDAERTGGVSYNQQVVVLSESTDKIWQRIRLEDSQQEGWIKAGNIKRIE